MKVFSSIGLLTQAQLSQLQLCSIRSDLLLFWNVEFIALVFAMILIKNNTTDNNSKDILQKIIAPINLTLSL